MNSVKKAILVGAAIFTIAALAVSGVLDRLGVSVRPAPQQTVRPLNDDYKQIAKWAVSYADMDLGLVEGKATCRWEPTSSTQIRRDHLSRYAPGRSVLINPDDLETKALPVRCEIEVWNPRTGQLHVLSASTNDIGLPDARDRTLAIALHGQWPSRDRVAPPPVPSLSLRGASGETAKIIIKNGSTQSDATVDISATAAPDSDMVRLFLNLDPDTGFSGRWEYSADPLTERDAGGFGPVGIFDTLRDEDIADYAPSRPGGFLGRQTGGMYWRPLPPTIFAIHVLEDQAEFAGAAAKYPHRDGNNYDSTRTLVIIGRDLPVLDNDPIFDIKGEDGIQYAILANSRGKDLSDANRRLFERAWRDVTSGWNEKEAADFRKLDAVLVRADLRGRDPGPKHITWGTAESTWTLQYGDNTAAVSFKRLVGVPEPADIERHDVLRKIWRRRSARQPLSGATPDIEAETVSQLALPEKIFVEVETGTRLDDSTIPIIVGGAGITTVHLAATRVKEKDTVYRTPPIVLTSGAEPAGSGDIVVQVQPGARVLAAVDGEKTHFLRAVPTEAGTGPADRIDFAWTDRLKRAAGCAGRNFETDNWAAFARQPSEGEITFGDHAAMLLLRDAFIGAMRSQIAELQAAVSETVPTDRSDRLVDAWYRSMEPVVWKVPDYPLATFKVASPAGPVAFSEAYSDTFKDATFHPWSTADGEGHHLTWRREASREAINFALQTMIEATAKAQAIETCDRPALLKLTGSGFRNVAARVTPLLMKVRTIGGLAEPDYLARAYVSSLGTLAELKQAQKELAQARYAVVVTAAGLVVPPLAGAVWGAAAVAGKVAIGGLALFTYESAHQIYETYQAHEDVRFAFGAYATLGVDRYFDAASRATPWWQTGVSIFGNALLIGAPVAGQALSARAALSSEGLSIWRGERAVARLAEPELAALRALPAETRRDVAMALFEQQVRLRKLGVASTETEYLNGVFAALGREARGLAKITRDHVVDLISREALAPGDDLTNTTRITSPDPLRVAKTEIAAEDLFREARTELVEADEEVAEAQAPAEKAGVNVRPPLVETGIPKPIKTTPEMPIINERWGPIKITVGGRAYDVTFDVGRCLSEDSLFFNVYELKSAEGIPPELLAPLLGPGRAGKKLDLVIKVLKKNDPQMSKEIEGYRQLAQELGLPFESPVDRVAERMLKAQQRLVEAKAQLGEEIPHLKIAGWDDAQIENGGTATILLQEKFVKKPGSFEIHPTWKTKTGRPKALPGKHKATRRLDIDEVKAMFKDPGQHEAVVVLYKKLMQAKLGWLDGHLANIYFERRGGKWVAGILDQDLLGTWDDLNQGFYRLYQEGLKKNRFRWKSYHQNPLDPEVKDTTVLMYKMFEAKGYLNYKRLGPESGQLEQKLIDPATVKRIIPEMPYLDPPPAMPPKRSQRRPYGFAVLRDLLDGVGAGPRRSFLGRPAWAAA